MSPALSTFRVHYSLTTIEGVQRLHRDIDAPTPDAAVAAVVRDLKPRIASIGKVKRVRAAA